MARQYAPRVQVILHPIVSGGSTMDITDWFGESCVINTSKGVLEPAGSFSINFLDRPVGGSSVYALVHPMDGIEIRACHDSSKTPKVLMRGFVSRVSREEALDEDGTPVRRVSISGEDVGKVWLTQYLYFLPNAKDQDAVLTRYGILSRYFGSKAKSISGNDFVRQLGSVLADHVATLTANTKMGLSLGFAPEGEGEIPADLIQSFRDVSFHQFMSSLLDAGAFYELWIDDPGDGEALIRWRDLWSGPGGVSVSIDDIASLQCWRDDSRVSNWYFCWPRGGALLTQTDAYAEASRTGDLCDGRDYEWSKELHFGYRKVEVEFSLRPAGYPANNDQPREPQYQAAKMPMSEWIKKLTGKLKEL